MTYLCGLRPSAFLLLVAFVLVTLVAPSSAAKERRQEERTKVPRQHHGSPAVHRPHATHEVAVEAGKKEHHHSAPNEGNHRATMRAKAPGMHHRPSEHHGDKYAKQRMEEPKRRLEVQKPPKPFLQPPLVHKHERPAKHQARQEKDKHH